MHMLMAAFAAGALGLAAAGAPGFVDDVREDGGPPEWVEDQRATDDEASENGSENAAEPAGAPPEWVEDVKEDGGPPEWVEDVTGDGGPPEWVEDQRAEPSERSDR